MTDPRALGSRGFSVSTQVYGTVGDGVTDDTVALQRAIDSGAPSVIVAGTLQITSTIVLSNGTALAVPSGSSIVWSGAAGGTVIASPSGSVLTDSGVLCQGSGFIDLGNAGIGMYLHSHSGCVFEWRSQGASQTSTIVQSIADSTNGVNSSTNKWLSLRHDNNCGKLLYIAGDKTLGTYNTISNYGRMRCAGNCYVAGIEFGPNCDTNFFSEMISIDLAAGATGIKCADDPTCYGQHFADVNIAFYDSPSNRIGLYVGSQNRWIQVDRLYIDSSNSSEVDAGAVVVNSTALSYRVAIGSDVGSFYNMERLLSLGYSIQSHGLWGEAHVSVAPGVAQAIAVPSGAGIVAMTCGDSNFSGLLWVANATTRPPIPLAMANSTYVVFGNGALTNGGGTLGRLNINTCTDGKIYVSNRLSSETVGIIFTFVGAAGR